VGLDHFSPPAAASASYSTAVRSNELIVTAGQFGVDPGGAPVPFGKQARLALRRMIEAVELAGGDRDSIMSVRAYLERLEDYDEWNAAYRDVMGSGDRMPARTTVQVGGLVPPLLVEVEALATVATHGA
jgi:2-iminobutanoate/2-iminopropanoate deaminase